MSALRLENSDRVSPTWRKLVEHMKSERAELREKNDNPLDAEETANVRGRIAQLNELIELDNPVPGVDP